MVNPSDQENNRSQFENTLTYKSSMGHTVAYVTAGLAIFSGGLFATNKVMANIHDTIPAVIMIAMLGVPMLLFGIYVVASTIRYKINLTPDAIQIDEGFSSTVIPRTDIAKYFIDEKRTRLELTRISNQPKFSVNLAMGVDEKFFEWFANVQRKPEFKVSQPFSESKYPRLYKPSRNTSMFFIIPGLIMLGAYLQTLIQHPERGMAWFAATALILAGVMGFYLLIYFWYSVTLTADAITIKSLAQNKTVLRKGIQSYSFSYGGRFGPQSITLSFKNTTGSDNDVSRLPIDRIWIPLTFERDNEFNTWFSNFPCTSTNPLPKIREIDPS